MLADLPTELISLLPALLSTPSLNTLILTCHRLHDILQGELESRFTSLTPAWARSLLFWAIDKSNPHVVQKLLCPPHSIDPSHPFYKWGGWLPLHHAVRAKNPQIVALLLGASSSAGAETWDPLYSDSPCDSPLQLAAEHNDVATMALLLDHGAPIDAIFGDRNYPGRDAGALHRASGRGHMAMVRLLVAHGADLECAGHLGTALGFAVHGRHVDVVRFLLEKGADATATGPLDCAPAPLLYVLMVLRHPWWGRVEGEEAGMWQRLPLPEASKHIMALLLAYGARTEPTMAAIAKHLPELVTTARCSKEEFLKAIESMLKQAKEAIPDVLPW